MTSQVKTFTIDIKKDADSKDSPKSNAYEDPFENEYGDDIIEPPLPFKDLITLVRSSSILPQCIDAMKMNCEGFGYNLTPVVNEEELEKYKSEIEREKKKVKNFIDYASFDMSFTTLRKNKRGDEEIFGNAFWEVVRNEKGEAAGFNYIKAVSMRLCKQTESVEIKVLKRTEDSYDYEEVEHKKRFRKYVQIIGNDKVYFKEFGDPRRMDSKTGKYYDEDSEDETYDEATEVIHFKCIEDPESPYGIMRWAGSMCAVAGSLAVEDVNFRYFDEKAIPPIIITIAGATVGKKTEEAIREYLQSNTRGRRNYHKGLVISAVGNNSPNSLEKNPVKIEIKEMSQLKDAAFIEYDDKNRKKARSSFRLPPLYTGETDDYTRATALESKKIAEEQVFSPERAEFDYFINTKILPAMGIKYIKFESKSAPIDTSLEKAEVYEKLANIGLKVKEGRKLIEKIIDMDIEETDEFWNELPIKLAPYVLSKQNNNTGQNKDDEETNEDRAEKFIKSLVVITGVLRKKLRQENAY